MCNKAVLYLTLLLIISSNSLAQSKSELESAFITGVSEISTINLKSGDGPLQILTEEGEEVWVKYIKGGDGYFNFYTEEILDFTKSYVIKIGENTTIIQPHWKAIDELFTYEGELGIIFDENQIEFKLWAPLASEVSLNLFKEGLDEKSYRSIELERGDKGVWKVAILENLTGEFYSYSVTNFGETKEVLDPYAKSIAITTKETFFKPRGAIVNPKIIGPKLDFAEIDGYQKREDAIIWEINVRDFTVDPDISTEAKFGTFKAFSERLVYIKKLGITHIQLLPVLSSTYSDESIRDQRMMDYAVGTNYNWGYGPDSYFSIEGMYSENPLDPELRIKELKELINAIHAEGLGITLDVVYNHTARLSFLEDIVPGYYHFMDAEGRPKESYGGGRPGTTHAMVRKLIIDSIIYWTKEFKVDGFRFDLMGDLDAETIQIAFDEATKINPKINMVGECWRTFAGDDDDEKVKPADQDWMNETNSVSCFSDEMRNELKSGFGSEGEPRFITGEPRSIQTIFNNVIAKPSNSNEDDPGDVLQYIAAHDNLTLHDVIAQSIKKDPEQYENEIQKRIRLGNAIILTSQGVAFLHAGQEYGRTKQWKSTEIPDREFAIMDGFNQPYFIENSYDASDAINMFDWDKVTEDGIHKKTMEYTRGLIALRKSSDAFRLGTQDLVSKQVSLMASNDIAEEDLILFFKTVSTTRETFYVLINADSIERTISIKEDLSKGTVLVDSDEAGVTEVDNLNGVEIRSNEIIIDPLTVVIIKTE
tara:strand:- start:43433 stop:45721 length:2289 start_codon:yes stop_codon:yes gene_type:complete